jgi:aminopeptidase YwaD
MAGLAAAAAALLSVRSIAADESAITEASIRGHMAFLASDALRGRGSGTRDEWLAATYIGSQVARWGLEPLGDAGGFVQEVESGRPQPTAPPALYAGGQLFAFGEDFLTPGQGAGSVQGALVRTGTALPSSGGYFLLVADGETADPALAASALAVLSLPTPPTAARGRGAPASGGRRGGPAGPPPWRLTLTRPAYDRLAALPVGTLATLVADVEPGHTWNVVARLTGSDPVQARDAIVLTAHLDHLGVCALPPDTICNGADDDASGTTAVLEMAEALAKGPRPKRTVLFAWFGSEERGGAGARHFLADPPMPLKQMVANIEFEMIGRADPLVPPHALWLTGFDLSDLGPTLAGRGALLVSDPRPDQHFFERSDNIQLARLGIVAQTVSSFNLHADYHRPGDDNAHIDFAHMTEAIQSMLAPILWLANSTFRPAWLPGKCPAPCGGGRP